MPIAVRAVDRSWRVYGDDAYRYLGGWWWYGRYLLDDTSAVETVSIINSWSISVGIVWREMRESRTTNGQPIIPFAGTTTIARVATAKASSVV